MKYILILGIIMYFIPKVLRFSLKWFVSSQLDKVQRDFQNKSKANTRKEGEIKVDINPNKSTSKGNYTDGEYIDFEEVK
jgi:hypothetical protein